MRVSFCVVICAAVAAGCSSSDSGSAGGDDGSLDGSIDGSLDAGGDGSTLDVGGDGAHKDAPCGDTSADPSNCGACGNACAAGASCVDSKCTCPPYQSACGGACIPTSSDPKNCGGCGVTCPPGQVCSAGGCSDSCLPGLSPCAGACVDTSTDSKNCGTCGTACPPTDGCVDGACVPAAPLSPKTCTDGGPPIVIDPGDGTAPCGGVVSAKTFTWAICSCKDVQQSSHILVDGFDSTKGPYKPGELGGGVGANSGYIGSSEMDVWGQLWADTGGMSTSSKGEVHADLRVGADANFGEFLADKDAYFAASVRGDPLHVVGALHHPSGGALSGTITEGTLVEEPVTVTPPCACEPKDIIPVAKIVAAAAAANDDASIGLDPAILTLPGHPARIDLPCGKYYLKGFSLTGAAAIVAHGHVGLFIDGDIDASAFFSLTLDDKSTLDVFVSGTMTGSAMIKIGSANYPALTRVYFGGTSTLTLTSNTVIAGNLYDATAKILWTSDTDMFGSLFAGDFEVTAPLAVHYDREVVKTGGECPPPPPTGDAGAPDASVPLVCGVPATSCGSCRDCGNQACTGGTCGACTTSAECCAPLVCQGGCCVSAIK